MLLQPSQKGRCRPPSAHPAGRPLRRSRQRGPASSASPAPLPQPARPEHAWALHVSLSTARC